jgi:hypothetical protein
VAEDGDVPAVHPDSFATASIADPVIAVAVAALHKQILITISFVFAIVIRLK